ncbi:hypothetical protein SAMN06298215_1673 [Bacteroidales bacterium WCE2008]|nr:hypothetical protein SAMN06298215_1673 [Bacteroidales bacterium WCE2008]
MKQEKEFWLVTTGHLEDRLWFREEDDFKVGMNYVAVQAALTDVSILAFILMSNHVHFVLSCSENEAKEFVCIFKKQYGQYYSKKYSSKKLLRLNSVDFRQLSPKDESLERGIAYVQMNSVAANICSNSVNYPWGTGNCFFNPSPTNGLMVKNYSLRALRMLTHSHKKLPPDAVIYNGYVLPTSYIRVKLVESIFRTPRRMNYFLNTSSKARRKTASEGLPAFRDHIILATLPDLCMSLFQKHKQSELSQEELAELAKQLRFRFSSDPHQVARIIGTSYDDISKLLDSF